MIHIYDEAAQLREEIKYLNKLHAKYFGTPARRKPKAAVCHRLKRRTVGVGKEAKTLAGRAGERKA